MDAVGRLKRNATSNDNLSHVNLRESGEKHNDFQSKASATLNAHHAEMDQEAAVMWMQKTLKDGGFEPRIGLKTLATGVVLAQLIEACGCGKVPTIKAVKRGSAIGNAVALDNIKACIEWLEEAGMNVAGLDALAIRDSDSHQLLALVTMLRRFHGSLLRRAQGPVPYPANQDAGCLYPAGQRKVDLEKHTKHLNKWKLAAIEGLSKLEIKALGTEAEVAEMKLKLEELKEEGSEEVVIASFVGKLRNKEIIARKNRIDAEKEKDTHAEAAGAEGPSAVLAVQDACCCSYKMAFSTGLSCSCHQDYWSMSHCAGGCAAALLCCPCSSFTLCCCNGIACSDCCMGDEANPSNVCDPRNESGCLACVMGAACVGRVLGVAYWYGGQQRHPAVDQLIQHIPKEAAQSQADNSSAVVDALEPPTMGTAVVGINQG